MSANESSSPEYLKFMYDKVYDELNRCRDWPLKVMAFSSALHLALIGVANIKGGIPDILIPWRLQIVLSLSLLWLWTIGIIIRYHLLYLGYRNIQRKLQAMMRIGEWSVEGQSIFSNEWTTQKGTHIFVGWQGWLFYVIYVSTLSTMTIALVSQI